MGNSSSKRQSSASSTIPIIEDILTPTTPPPCLIRDRNRTACSRFPPLHEAAASLHSFTSPISPLSPTCAFPGRSHLNSTAHEVVVTTFAGESPPEFHSVSGINSDPPCGQKHDEPHEIRQISQPTAMRPKINRLSELIDPMDLVDDDEKCIRSPSGMKLSRRSYEARKDRPLCIRERQERIRRKVSERLAEVEELKIQKEVEQSGKDREKNGDGEKKSRGCCDIFSKQR